MGGAASFAGDNMFTVALLIHSTTEICMFTATVANPLSIILRAGLVLQPKSIWPVYFKSTIQYNTTSFVHVTANNRNVSSALITHNSPDSTHLSHTVERSSGHGSCFFQDAYGWLLVP